MPIEPLLLCNAGVEAALWLEDAAQLPAGLTFDPTDGTIAGTPACPPDAAAHACFGERDFRVRAYNAAGSSTATVALSIVRRPPRLGFFASVAPSLFRGESPPGGNNTVSDRGGAGARFEIVNLTAIGARGAALPDGLGLDATDGTVCGTPRGTAAPAKYVVVARNDGGVSTTLLWLRVTERAPDISGGFAPLRARTSVLTDQYRTLAADEAGQAATQLDMQMGDALPEGAVPLRSAAAGSRREG